VPQGSCSRWYATPTSGRGRGRQPAPYFDGVNHRLFETNDVFNLWIVNGEIDFQARHVDAAAYTLYKESEASGDYKVVVGVSAGHVAVQLNLATKNDKLAASSSIPQCALRPILCF